MRRIMVAILAVIMVIAMWPRKKHYAEVPMRR